MGRKHLDHWADVCDDHSKITEFVDWLRDHKIVFESEVGDFDRLMTPRDLIDAFFGVDRRELDKERRELLESARSIL